MALLEQLRQHQPEDPDEAAHLGDDRRLRGRRRSARPVRPRPSRRASDGQRVRPLRRRNAGPAAAPPQARPLAAAGRARRAGRGARRGRGAPGSEGRNGHRRALHLHPAAPRPVRRRRARDPGPREGEPAHLHLDLRYVVWRRKTRRFSGLERDERRCRWFGVGRPRRTGARRRAAQGAGEGRSGSCLRHGPCFGGAQNDRRGGRRGQSDIGRQASWSAVAHRAFPAVAAAQAQGDRRELPRFGVDVEVVNLSVSVADAGAST